MSETIQGCPSDITGPRIDYPEEGQTVLQRFAVIGGGHARYHVRLITEDEKTDLSAQMQMGSWGDFTLRVNQDLPENQYVEFRVLLWGDRDSEYCVHDTRPLRKVWMHQLPQPGTPRPGATITVDQVFEGTGGYRGEEIRLTSGDGSDVFGFDTVSESGTWKITPTRLLPPGEQQLALEQDVITIGAEPNAAQVGGREMFRFNVVAPNV
ncbi:hypothetical protein [Pseudomonas fluorescens]|uniref:hypothetical protein n=1 Tax=Pseudomonas fluorescens TaxID=294 RepID=UPI003D092481